MGEAARLWLILMPWAVWLAAGCFAPPDAAPSLADDRLSNRATLLILVCQMMVCLGTVMRVTGFRWL